MPSVCIKDQIHKWLDDIQYIFIELLPDNLTGETKSILFEIKRDVGQSALPHHLKDEITDLAVEAIRVRGEPAGAAALRRIRTVLQDFLKNGESKAPPPSTPLPPPNAATWRCEKVHESPLRPARSEEEYLLHQAALEWSLDDCIVIQGPEDIQSRANWEGRLTPYHHQVQNLITFTRRAPIALLADDVGLGKTISAGLILSELIARKKVSRTLILCPTRILCEQWAGELREKFGITAEDPEGKQLDKDLTGGPPVVVTTYKSATSRLPKVGSSAFDMLILDEAHHLRNLHPSKKAPALAKSVRSALESRLFRYVVMLTATPIQNRIWDLYSLIDCLTAAKSNRNPLGTPEQFKNRYLMPGSDGRRLHPANAEAFRGAIKEYVARMRRGDVKLKFPTRVVQNMPVVLSLQEQELIRLLGQHVSGLSAFEQSSLVQALMSSPQAFAAQMRNMATERSRLQEAAGRSEALAASIPEPAKLRHLLVLCGQLKASRPDWRVVVFTHRIETQKLIGEALRRIGISVDFIRGGEHRANQQAIEGFRGIPPRAHAIISTDAGTEGINLQVANVLVNYDLPWNPMVVEQRIGRLQRLKADHDQVLVWNLVGAGTAEETVVARLMEKLRGIVEAIGDIDSILKAPEWDGDKDPFEAQIRKLVVKSLLRQDVEEATRLSEESIEKAKRLITEVRPEIDQAFGNPEEFHQNGAWMPRLDRRPPSIPVKDFVLRAKRAEGGTVLESASGVYEVRTPGRPHEVLTFDEKIAEARASQAVFMGNIRLFQAGKGEFERLVQQWVDRCGHHVSDRRRHTDSDAEDLARAWCETIPAAHFLGQKIVGREPRFQGHVQVKVKAVNGVDGYEKLLIRAVHPDRHKVVQQSDEPSDLIEGPSQASDLLPGCTAQLAQMVELDSDLGKFCGFYEARRTEELSKAGADNRASSKISEAFTPIIAADVVGFRGVSYDEVRLQVRFSLQGAGDYEVTLRAVPAASQLLEEPERKECEHTALRVPVGCLELREPDGKRTLRHLLERSDASGRWFFRGSLVTDQLTGKKFGADEGARSAVSGTVALKSAFVRCQQTGEWLLPSEAGRSDYSGKIVLPKLLQRSEKGSDRRGLPDEFGVCAVTGKRLLLDELGTSTVSEKQVDRELLRASAYSGKLALADETVKDELTGEWILRTEAQRSDFSGKVVRPKVLQTSQKPPGRRGLPDEFGVCAVTGQRLLLDELGRSAVSGKLADKDFLRASALSGKLALESEMERCRVTGQWLLRSEATRSDLSGKPARPGVLQRSEKSPGRQGLPEEFGVCEVTGKRLLLDELGRSAVSSKLVDKALLRKSAASDAFALENEFERCTLTNAFVLPAELETCAVTGVRGLRNKMVCSAVSGKFVVREKAVRCAWLGQPVLQSESKKCSLTRTVVAKQFLNRWDELIPLAKLCTF